MNRNIDEIWQRLTRAAGKTVETDHDGPGHAEPCTDAFADSVLAEVHQRPIGLVKQQRRLVFAASLASCAAALLMIVWCADAVDEIRNPPPVLLSDVFDLEPVP